MQKKNSVSRSSVLPGIQKNHSKFRCLVICKLSSTNSNQCSNFNSNSFLPDHSKDDYTLICGEFVRTVVVNTNDNNITMRS